jgi:hypothetical protein
MSGGTPGSADGDVALRSLRSHCRECGFSIITTLLTAGECGLSISVLVTTCNVFFDCLPDHLSAMRLVDGGPDDHPRWSESRARETKEDSPAFQRWVDCDYEIRVPSGTARRSERPCSPTRLSTIH